MTRYQLGRFSVSQSIIENHPDSVSELFKMTGCIPVRVDSLFAQATIEYTAICDKFEIVPLGMVIPEYKVIFEKDERGKVKTITFQKAV